MTPLSLGDVAVVAAEGVGAPTLARSPPSPFDTWDVSGQVALVSDYRLGGVTRSQHAATMQASVDVKAPHGWSFGAFASGIDKRKGGDFEMEVHAAKTFAIGDTELSVGALWVVTPQTQGEDFGIAQASVSRPVGPVDLTLAVNYAWPQANIDNEDNYSVRLRARTPIGRLAGVPITLNASAGHAEGTLTIEHVKNDWSLGAVAAVGDVDIGLTYVDTDLEDRRGRPGVILSIAYSF